MRVCRHQARDGLDEMTGNSRHTTTDNNKLNTLLKRRNHVQRNLRDRQQHRHKNLLIDSKYNPYCVPVWHLLNIDVT